MDATTVHIIWTVVGFVTFLGIIAWAWSSKRRKRFDDAARSIFDGDELSHAEAGRERGARDNG